MIGPGKWLCGCTPESKAHYQVERRDARGTLCPEHGEPMYGFLSPVIHTASGKDMTDWGKMGMGGTLRLKPTEFEDKRDNRSPMQAYMARQKEKAMKSNGHVHE